MSDDSGYVMTSGTASTRFVDHFVENMRYLWTLDPHLALALDRIEDDDYGICEMCDREISIARMKVRPMTTLCIECKTKQESYEKVSGF